MINTLISMQTYVQCPLYSLQRTWLYSHFLISGTVSRFEALQIRITQPVVLRAKFRYSLPSTTKLISSVGNGSLDAAGCKVGLASKTSQLRFVANLPPRPRPIPLRTLAGCSSTPLLSSLLTHPVCSCVSAYAGIVAHRPVPTDRAGRYGHVILSPTRDWPAGA
jgi:hypothetical protein